MLEMRFTAPAETNLPMPRTPRLAIDLHVGRTLRLLRQARGLSQSDFGKVLAVSFQQIQKFENGLNRMSVSQLSAAAEHFGVDLAYFIPRPAAAGPSPTSNVDRDDTQAFVRSRRGRQLIEAFLAIRNESTREAMLRLLRAMAEAE